MSRDSLSRIKAVLVVGYCEDLTKQKIDEAKEIASYLQSLGVHVSEFYPPNDKWQHIVRASVDANIFLYSGHGTTMGEQGKVGGLCLSKEVFISSDSIYKELKLHKNALVLFQSVCYAAGSSASDNSDIGAKVALQRVSDYAHPFVKLGVAGYYANDYLNTSKQFLKEFLNKKNIEQIYVAATSSYCQIQLTKKYIYNTNFEVSVASPKNISGFATRTSYVNGKPKIEKIPVFKEYEVAYVGIPTFTVLDFFK